MKEPSARGKAVDSMLNAARSISKHKMCTETAVYKAKNKTLISYEILFDSISEYLRLGDPEYRAQANVKEKKSLVVSKMFGLYMMLLLATC